MNPETNREEIIYKNPKDNLEKGEDPLHTIDLMLDGKIIGRAEITYYSRPFPLYQISELYVEPEYQGAGRASKIMDQIEEFLIKKGKAGVLVDAIDPDSPASGMYARRGWQEVPEQGGLFAFNLPDGASINDLRGYPYRQTPILDRKRK